MPIDMNYRLFAEEILTTGQDYFSINVGTYYEIYLKNVI